jgi:hypothetical protein
MRRVLLSAIFAASTGANVLAQSADAPAPCSDAAFAQFDFWLGDWGVYAPDDTFAGNNQITREEGGCLILERWTSVNGGTGQSYNYYNPATEKWRQVWVSQGAQIDYEGGLTDAGSMKLIGTITYVANGQQADFTGEWTPNADGSVTQHFEQFNSETDAWDVWFTGRYVRSAPDTESPD